MRLFRNAALCASVLLGLLLGACNDSSDEVSQSEAADQSYTFTIPLFKFFQTQRSQIAQGLPPNFFLHLRALADATAQTVTKPNHDTLYSTAWLKLDNGPLEIDIPASGDRYFSLALMDAYTNNFAVRGTRTDGGLAVRFWVAGPDWVGTAPEGTVLLQSATNSVWALGRTYVDGTDADYPLAWAVQDQLKIIVPAGTTPTTAWGAVDLLTPPSETDYPNYFPYVDQLLTQEPPPAADDAYLAAGPNTIGVGVGLSFDTAAVDMTQITTGADAARARALTIPSKVTSSGWAYADAEIGAYGSDYELRAQLSLSGFGALPTAEAVYYIANTAIAAPTVPLAGDTVYTMTFAADQLPPTGAFWSLTLYVGQDPNHEYFYANPDNIFAISYPASNPAFNEDGSLTLTISNVQPDGVPLSNWLPAPTGTYSLQLRDYLPPDSVLTNTYVLPPLVAQLP